jgi:hypothetical protein
MVFEVVFHLSNVISYLTGDTVISIFAKEKSFQIKNKKQKIKNKCNNFFIIVKVK